MYWLFIPFTLRIMLIIWNLIESAFVMFHRRLYHHKVHDIAATCRKKAFTDILLLQYFFHVQIKEYTKHIQVYIHFILFSPPSPLCLMIVDAECFLLNVHFTVCSFRLLCSRDHRYTVRWRLAVWLW